MVQRPYLKIVTLLAAGMLSTACSLAEVGGPTGVDLAGVEAAGDEFAAVQTLEGPKHPAYECILTLRDIEALGPDLPAEFTKESLAETDNGASCHFSDEVQGKNIGYFSYGETFIDIDQREYIDRGWGFEEGYIPNYGAICENGLRMQRNLVLNYAEDVSSQLENFHNCQSHPMTNPINGKEYRNPPLSVYYQGIAGGLYCHIPSKCFLVTDDIFFVISSPYRKGGGGTAEQRELTYKPMRVVAQAIVDKMQQES